MAQRTARLEARNDELDTFAHVLAHDIKGQIGTVSGFTELMIMFPGQSKFSEEKQQELLAAISDGLLSMRQLVDGLLVVARLTHEQVEPATLVQPIAMGELLEGLLRQYEYRFDEAHAHISHPEPESWPSVLGYRPWVEQIWINYLGNALKYGGRPPEISLGWEARDELIRFWVADRGPGLSGESRQRLFRPYTRRSGEVATGHGLGLYIVSRLAEVMGNRVGVEENPGGGSRFWFELPAGE